MCTRLSRFAGFAEVDETVFARHAIEGRHVLGHLGIDRRRGGSGCILDFHVLDILGEFVTGGARGVHGSAAGRVTWLRGGRAGGVRAHGRRGRSGSCGGRLPLGPGVRGGNRRARHVRHGLSLGGVSGRGLMTLLLRLLLLGHVLERSARHVEVDGRGLVLETVRVLVLHLIRIVSTGRRARRKLERRHVLLLVLLLLLAIPAVLRRDRHGHGRADIVEAGRDSNTVGRLGHNILIRGGGGPPVFHQQKCKFDVHKFKTYEIIFDA